jgi:hypothetical protein
MKEIVVEDDQISMMNSIFMKIPLTVSWLLDLK